MPKSTATTPWTQKEREELRLIRLHRGWSWREMAEQIGVLHEANLRRLVEEDRRPRATTTFKLREWLTKYRDQQPAVSA